MATYLSFFMYMAAVVAIVIADISATRSMHITLTVVAMTTLQLALVEACDIEPSATLIQAFATSFELPPT